MIVDLTFALMDSLYIFLAGVLFGSIIRWAWPSKKDSGKHLLHSINLKLDKMANELDDLTTQVSETNTVIGSAITLIKGIKAALDAAGTDKTKLKALRDSLDSSETDLANAVAENTPAPDA